MKASAHDESNEEGKRKQSAKWQDRGIDVLVVGNANREWADGNRPPFMVNGQFLAVNSAAQLTVTTVQKIQAVISTNHFFED